MPTCSRDCRAWSSTTTPRTMGPARSMESNPGAAATCEMVALLAVRLGIPLDADGGALAAALMAGVVMDTATFAHSNATPRTLIVSAALVEAGAPLSDTRGASTAPSPMSSCGCTGPSSSVSRPRLTGGSCGPA